MRRNRAQIVGDEMQKVLSDIILNKLKDPRIPLLTSITGVKMSSDLTHANIDVSVFGTDEQKTECIRAIEHAKGFIRTEMCKKINLRVAPELHFALDNTLDEAARMDSLIDRTIENDRKIREESGNEGTL
ncbi:MAG: 30S ribosome-binding factor RbfA [Clostridiales bacterium]|jgi:ribosome-binding factor A|nr:30S ribosome-binding factor RbfA [Clostridiales bacterium]HAW16019.1 30S ribosome-binding factor RbfA [Clostridiales bacterium]